MNDKTRIKQRRLFKTVPKLIYLLDPLVVFATLLGFLFKGLFFAEAISSCALAVEAPNKVPWPTSSVFARTDRREGGLTRSTEKIINDDFTS